MTALLNYALPDRHYHNLTHIAFMLRGLEDYFPEHNDNAILRSAIVYHDVYYVPGDPENEAHSARIFGEEMVGRLTDDQIHEGQRLIMLTKHHTPEPGDELGAVICDLDLMGLGQTLGIYLSNRKKVRAEFSAATSEQWKVGRRAFIEGMLSRETIFHTRVGRQEWEGPARDYLKYELENIEAWT